MSGIEFLPRAGEAFLALADAHALSPFVLSTSRKPGTAHHSRIHAPKVLFRVGAFIHLHPDVAGGLGRSGLVLFDEAGCSVVLFRDLVLAIESRSDHARVKVLKSADSRDLDGDMNGLARRMGDAWLTVLAIRRRNSPGQDLKGRRLVSRVRDLLSMVPVASGARIVVARPMSQVDPVTVHVDSANTVSERSFLERAARHAVGVAGPAWRYVQHGEGGLPYFAGSWARCQRMYSVEADMPASATLRAIGARAAGRRVASWLEETLAPDDLVRVARSYDGAAST